MRLGSDGKAGLSPYYLNTNRLGALGGVDIPAEAQVSLNTNNIDRVKAMQFAGSVARALLRSGRIPALAAAYANNPTVDQWLAFTTVSLSFKGARIAFEDETRGRPIRRATFKGSLLLGETEHSISGGLYNQHFYSQSSISMLSGRKMTFVMGQFALSKEGICLTPYFLGDLVDEGSPLSLSLRSSIRIYPDHIDSFSRLAGAPAAAAKDVEALQRLSEAQVKAAIAEIIGENFVPADWGGEASDLQTNRLVVDGIPAAAAFILKGPALRGEMHPANMGKRGDQLIRAFNEPVSLVVIQHCNKIASSVVALAEALALHPAKPRHYCIFDGNDTARLLKAYGKL